MFSRLTSFLFILHNNKEFVSLLLLDFLHERHNGFDGKRKFLLCDLIAILKDYNLSKYNKCIGVIVLDCEGIDDPKPWATKHDFKNMENQHIMFPKRHNTFLEDYKDMMDG